jgi:uncharacterized 2Fe-2S/4Fe-4S cluster protein (DUF4445 family)
MPADRIRMNRPRQDVGIRLGAAVDLGTTEIRVCVWDLTRDERLGCETSPNPQVRFGQDVLSRLASAAEAPEQANHISSVALEAIGTSIRNVCSRHSAPHSAVASVAIVGNTAMLSLLTEQGYSELLRPSSWSRHLACRFADAKAVSSAWGLSPGCSLEVIQPLRGFVGSDLIAGLLATDLAAGRAGSLLIDFGANTEIALWDGARMWATSAAGGPAFESGGADFGALAQPGAVWRIERVASTAELDIAVIGDEQPRGFCASGLVDAVAHLLASGLLSPTGRFSGEAQGRSSIALRNGEGLAVSSRDVDALQRAKAGVAAASQCLLAHAGMSANDLTRVCVSGAFGSHLNIRNAVDIGLIPHVETDLVEPYGNTALAGCELLLRGQSSSAGHSDVGVVNMSFLREYEEAFVDNLFLRPWDSHECVSRTPGAPR